MTETVEARCARYIEENRFVGAEVDKHRQIILRAGSVDTIQMPEELGDLVWQELRRRGLTTPTFQNLGTRVLTFVTGPAREGDPRPVHILSRMFRVQAIRTVQGSLITLPGPTDERRVWVEEPVGTARPDFDTVVDIVLDAAKCLPKAG
ncbi:hypothetical protein [Nocardia otitidiscaviarum]|uniref:hypothetical protein n=1 Tax=Nocardia otitidiscaviarum TaxID=1823 RepID=UPI000B1BCBCB|nr:hypothetical protein [Nocardia otitidiscaviarum]